MFEAVAELLSMIMAAHAEGVKFNFVIYIAI